jgi:hypothetical protein
MKKGMKSSIGRCSYLATGAFFLTIALVAPAAAETVMPFNGWVQGQESDTVQGNPPAKILVDGSLPGLATNIGRCTLKYTLTVSLPAGSSTGTGQLVAANGDTIYTTVVGKGVGVPDIPGLNRIVEHNTITGGTGRFAGIKGSFTVERLVDLPTGFTSGGFRGMIISSGEHDDPNQ